MESNKHYCAVTKLTGKELLAKIKDLGEAAKDVVARETGYVVTKKDGTERFQYNTMYEAIMEAKGVAFAPAVTARPGRQLSYKAVVQGSGNLIIGKGYTATHGAVPTDEFTIELLEDGAFKLTPIYEDGAAAAPEGQPAAA